MDIDPEAVRQSLSLELQCWQMIKDAAARSRWMNEEYDMKRWTRDVCRFLRLGPIPAGAGFDENSWSTVILCPTRAWHLAGALRPTDLVFSWGQDLYYLQGYSGTRVAIGGVPTDMREHLTRMVHLKNEFLERPTPPEGE